jgi:hypothetical protein
MPTSTAACTEQSDLEHAHALTDEHKQQDVAGPFVDRGKPTQLELHAALRRLAAVGTPPCCIVQTHAMQGSLMPLLTTTAEWSACAADYAALSRTAVLPPSSQTGVTDPTVPAARC